MDNFNLDELMDLADAYVGPMVDAIYRRLIERDFALEDPEVVMLLTALINILGHDNRGDRPTEVLLMAAYGERGVLDRPNIRVMRWRNGALSGSDLANEPGLGSSRTYQPGEMPMPSKPKPGLTRMHQEMNSEATSSGSPLRAAVPPKRAKVTQKVQTNQTIQDLDEMNDQLRSTKKELDEMTRSMLQMEEDRDMWRKLFEDCNKKQGQEIERLRQGIQRAIGAGGVDNGRGESDTCKGYSSWAVPDGALDTSRNESNNGDTASSRGRDESSNNPGS